jgi:hypothetical protein
MSEALKAPVERSVVKKPLMTFFYQSEAVPKAAFEGEQLTAFYQAIQGRMPGASEFLDLVKPLWNPKATHYQWTMPDGFVVRIPVLQAQTKVLEIDELNHFKMAYRTTVVAPVPKGRSLAANIVHSVDGYVCREMVRRANKQGYALYPIHDCFFSHPNYLNQVRQNYVDILAEISQTNLLESIISQLTGSSYSYTKHGEIAGLILGSEYALS